MRAGSHAMQPISWLLLSVHILFVFMQPFMTIYIQHVHVANTTTCLFKYLLSFCDDGR